MKFTLLLAATLLLSGCSVYESDGRKTLERGGITFAKNAHASFVSCDVDAPSGSWTPLESQDRADLFSSENESFDLLVAPNSDSFYTCSYRFQSAQEMYENTSSAIDDCLHQSPANCHGEFAFR